MRGPAARGAGRQGGRVVGDGGRSEHRESDRRGRAYPRHRHVHPAAKRRGVARRLVRAAAEHARGRGATVLDAYPADHLGGTSSTDFMGVKQWFLDEGFTAVRRARSKTVVRLDLG
ncbi:MAG: GNAT family N-acetyltransferase [Acidimicrobiales bacterium]